MAITENKLYWFDWYTCTFRSHIYLLSPPGKYSTL